MSARHHHHHRHRGRHSLLLLARLFDLQQHASPFTLILDSLNQSGRPLVDKFILGAKKSRGQVIFLSFETVTEPRNVDVFLKANCYTDQAQLLKDIVAHRSSPSSSPSPPRDTLLVIDSLNDLAEFVGGAALLPAFLSSSSLPMPAGRARTTLLGIFHTDVVAAPPPSYAPPYAPYAPPPYAPYAPSYAPPALALLRYLATAILTAHCLAHELQRKRARDRALAEPAFGVAGAGGERIEGVLVGLGANGGGSGGARGGGGVGHNGGGDGVLVEMELRRKSGRGVRECFVLLFSAAEAAAAAAGVGAGTGPGMAENFVRLDDYPPYHESEDVALLADAAAVPGEKDGKEKGKGKDKGREDGEGVETTFNLTLSQKQRQDREGVVLPYFDAQRWEGGVGEGGRILYQMGAEDDFDDEEDEI